MMIKLLYQEVVIISLKYGINILFDRLYEMDPEYASTITKNDKQKIMRALEIMTLTNNKVSSFSWKNRIEPLDYNFCCWFL